MKINFAQISVIKQLKSPEILVLQRKIPDDSTGRVIKSSLIPWGRLRHSFCTFPSLSLRLGIERKSSQAVAWFLCTFCFFFWMQSFWKHRLFSWKTWSVRCWRTRPRRFLSFFLSLGRRRGLRATVCSLLPLGVPLWYEIETLLTSSETRRALYLQPGTEKAWASPDSSNFLWIQRKFFIPDCVKHSNKICWGTKNVKIT